MFTKLKDIEVRKEFKEFYLVIYLDDGWATEVRFSNYDSIANVINKLIVLQYALRDHELAKLGLP